MPRPDSREARRPDPQWELRDAGGRGPRGDRREERGREDYRVEDFRKESFRREDFRREDFRRDDFRREDFPRDDRRDDPRREEPRRKLGCTCDFLELVWGKGENHSVPWFPRQGFRVRGLRFVVVLLAGRDEWAIMASWRQYETGPS